MTCERRKHHRHPFNSIIFDQIPSRTKLQRKKRKNTDEINILRSNEGIKEERRRERDMGITRSLTRLLARWFTHPVRRRLEGPGRGPRSTRAVSAASPSSRFTRHYTMSQGWQLLSLDSRLRLKLAREELALSLPPNPEDAPLLLTPRPRNHASFSFFPAGFHP